MFGAIAHFVGRRLEAFLAAPIKGFTPLTTGDPQALARCIRPADVLLIEGSARISTAGMPPTVTVTLSPLARTWRTTSERCAFASDRGRERMCDLR